MGRWAASDKNRDITTFSRHRDPARHPFCFQFKSMDNGDTVLTTVVIKLDKNPTKIPIAWCFKLTNSATSCDEIESASLYPSEIWQPWCPNFGNPENQIAYLQVFEHAWQEYGVYFYFQGCHLFMNYQISWHVATLKIKICLKCWKIDKTIMQYSNYVTGF